MARFDFRQGIARRQEDGLGNPNFLLITNGGAYIDLIISPDPTIVCIAHYDVDYMVVENASVTKAWGPFTVGTNYWLYWDIDFVTGLVTRGYTTLEPIVAATAPVAPSPDQHWFDTTVNVIKVWAGSAWIEKIRVFAVKYANGVAMVHYALRSQVGLNDVTSYAGHILFDPTGTPLQKFQRNRRGQFITTETDLHAQFSRIANFRVEAAVVQGRAAENIPIHHVIALNTTSNELILARNAVPDYPAFGLAMEDMVVGEVRSYITKGFVTNEIDWDWSDYAPGTPLFVGATGALQILPPQTVSIQQVAVVVNRTTVFVNIQPILRYSSTTATIPIQLDTTTGTQVVQRIDGSDVQFEMAQLTDVEIAGLQNNDLLTYDIANQTWVNIPNAGITPPVGSYRAWGYEHTQGIAADIWLIEHNLETDRVIVQIFDDLNAVIWPDDITVLDENMIQITFTEEIAGRASVMVMI